MFQVTVTDHVRLSFASVLAAYEGHADAAARLARWNSYAKMILLVLSGLAAGTGAIAISGSDGWTKATAFLTAILFGTCAAYVALNQQPLMYGHRISAAKLWVICEKYRALLAEMHDNNLDSATVQQRRNELLSDAAAVLEQASPDDRYTYEIAKQAMSGPQGAGYSDAVIDRYLPATLRKEPPAHASQKRATPPAA